MSRIGKLPIEIPAGVTVDVKDNVITVKGPKGTLSQKISSEVSVSVENGVCQVSRPNDEKQTRADHGLVRALINSMMIGVSKGYRKEMELIGVGYRVSNNGQVLEFALGYTHNIFLQLPSEVKIETKNERNQNPQLILECCDKQLLGQVCAKIRSFRKPEPYKGKGIRFIGEIVRKKAGKSASAK